MKLKRSKQYRKLMHQYALTFGHREPYQVIVDAEMLQDAGRFKMDLAGGLERTLQGKVKILVTQCSMRHLYNAKPKNDALITQAKSYERRRCNHHELENPLSTLECLSEVVDPKNTSTNKHRYVIASQQDEVRSHFRREVLGVPLVYINRSVMILEPMPAASQQVREREEKGKFRAGLRSTHVGSKRKRDEESEAKTDAQQASSGPRKRTKAKGPKGPNPLSIKKPKKRTVPSGGTKSAAVEVNDDP